MVKGGKNLRLSLFSPLMLQMGLMEREQTFANK